MPAAAGASPAPGPVQVDVHDGLGLAQVGRGGGLGPVGVGGGVVDEHVETTVTGPDGGGSGDAGWVGHVQAVRQRPQFTGTLAGQRGGRGGVPGAVNPPAADARHILARIAHGRVPATIATDLLIGATEAVTNAQRHGRPPVTVRIWAAPGHVVVTVHDTGPGPADRLAGLVPVPSSTPGQHPGMGLWVTHQFDIDVTLRHADDGFTVRLRHLPGSSGTAATAG